MCLGAYGLARRVVSVARRQQSQESRQEIGVTLWQGQAGLAKCGCERFHEIEYKANFFLCQAPKTIHQGAHQAIQVPLCRSLRRFLILIRVSTGPEKA